MDSGLRDCESGAVSLRELTAADLPALFAQQRDADACRMAAVIPREREKFDAH
jgi:hypothetical protein